MELSHQSVCKPNMKQHMEKVELNLLVRASFYGHFTVSKPYIQ